MRGLQRADEPGLKVHYQEVIGRLFKVAEPEDLKACFADGRDLGLSYTLVERRASRVVSLHRNVPLRSTLLSLYAAHPCPKQRRIP